MARTRRSILLPLGLLSGTLLAFVALGSPSPSANASPAKRIAQTGKYQLYCPDPVETPIVLHVRATAMLVPAAPVRGRHFLVSGFQTEVTFPQGLASALAQMSPIAGKVTGALLVVGAVPDVRAVAESFVAIVPASLPPAGFNFWVPSHGANLGTFAATAKTVVVEEASRFRLTLTVGKGTQAETRVLTCEAFANNTRDFEPAQPWVGTKEPPLAEAITPVIALGG
jgi:hypothetical protein